MYYPLDLVEQRRKRSELDCQLVHCYKADRVVCELCHPEFFFVVRVINSKTVVARFWYTIQQFRRQLRQHEVLVFVIVSLYDGVTFLCIARDLLRGDNFVGGNKFLGGNDLGNIFFE